MINTNTFKAAPAGIAGVLYRSFYFFYEQVFFPFLLEVNTLSLGSAPRLARLLRPCGPHQTRNVFYELIFNQL